MEQIIDEYGNIVPRLDEQIKKSGIAEDGVDYHTLAIIGCQSSGKSTLLNLLFGTKFLTMNDQIGRQQTTLGIHAAKAVNAELLVFDVEGSDSRERGDSDALFERKSSLFALALCEVLIVNMWESDIGRYNAANIPMLKVVFEVNVQLFLAENQVKSKILFVIRDRTAPNFEVITTQIVRDMNNIWNEIQLPEKLQGKQITDFFEFEFFSIHHMKIENEKFNADIDTLRKWFVDKTYKDYIFNEKSDKIVPGEGLSQYIRNLWTVINENRDLNIPSQKTMLAQFKCDENAKLALATLTEELTPKVITPLETAEHPIDNFKEKCEGPIEKCLKFYRDNSWRYDEKIVSDRQKQLRDEIKKLIEPSFEKQCSFFAQDAKNDFTKYIKAFNTPFFENQTWSLNAQAKLDAVFSNLISLVNSNKVLDFNMNYDVHILQQEMTNLLIEKEKELVELTHELVITETIRDFEAKANDILKDCKSTMWEDLRKTLKGSTQSAIDEISNLLKTNAPKCHPYETIQTTFEDHALSLVKESANYVMLKMKRSFDRSFKYEQNGRPRVWKKKDNINEIYENSRRNALQVLRLFTYCRLADPKSQVQNDRLNQILIPLDKSVDIEQKFERIIIHAYEEARSILKATQNNQKIPPWAWLLLFVFSGDYMLKLLGNPIIFSFVMLFGGLYFVISQLGLTETVEKALLAKFNQALSSLTNSGNKTAENEAESVDVSNEKVFKRPMTSPPMKENIPKPNVKRTNLRELMEKAKSKAGNQSADVFVSSIN